MWSHPLILVAWMAPVLLATACSDGNEEDCGSDSVTACEGSATTGRATPFAQDLAPLPGQGPTFSTLTATGYTVSWTAGIDQVTSSANLEYKLIQASFSEEIDSLGEALNPSGSAVVVMDWNRAVLSRLVSEPMPQDTSFAVLVRDEVGNISAYPPQTLRTGAPLAGADLTFSNVTESGFTVSWGAATSSSEAASNMEYRVVRASEVTAIDTVAEHQSAAAVVMDWTKGVLSAQVNGLPANTTVAVAVMVRDETERTALYMPKTIQTSPYRVIFKTNAQFSTTQLTPSTSADALCNADTAKPLGRRSFKALIAGSDRIACTSSNCSASGESEHTNWVMDANRTYENKNGQVLWTTNASGVVIAGAFQSSVFPNSNQFVWTGLDAGWVKAPVNCSDWLSTSASDLGRVGTANATTEASWTSFHQACSGTASIYCVEQ